MRVCRHATWLVRSCWWMKDIRQGPDGLARASRTLDLVSCLKGDLRVSGKSMRQEADAEQKIDVGTGNETSWRGSLRVSLVMLG